MDERPQLALHQDAGAHQCAAGDGEGARVGVRDPTRAISSRSNISSISSSSSTHVISSTTTTTNTAADATPPPLLLLLLLLLML